jgi:hypothetical protein
VTASVTGHTPTPPRIHDKNNRMNEKTNQEGFESSLYFQEKLFKSRSK